MSYQAYIARNLTPAIDTIKAFEGIEDGDPTTVNLDPYLCPSGYWTIGWGHLVRDHHGNPIQGKMNKAMAFAMYPDGITMIEAEILLKDDMRSTIAAVNRYVKVPVTDNQYCALVSFTFNMGARSLRDSTLLRRINAYRYEDAPAQFKRWNKGRVDDELVVMNGLVRRRQVEADLWMKAA